MRGNEMNFERSVDKDLSIEHELDRTKTNSIGLTWMKSK